MTHTPGPWVNRTVGDPTNKSGGQIYAGKVNVATCHFGSHDTPEYDDYKANARLIAAAPELLDALKKIVAWHDCFPPTSGEEDLPIISQARSAIAQAEGRGK